MFSSLPFGLVSRTPKDLPIAFIGISVLVNYEAHFQACPSTANIRISSIRVYQQILGLSLLDFVGHSTRMESQPALFILNLICLLGRPVQRIDVD